MNEKQTQMSQTRFISLHLEQILVAPEQQRLALDLQPGVHQVQQIPSGPSQLLVVARLQTWRVPSEQHASP